MEPVGPYTTGELASLLDAPRQIVRHLLDALAGDEKIRKKEPEPDRTIWVREPPKNECLQCGGEFEVKYFHPIFQAVQYCPKCGAQLRRKD
jgi:Zn finger protein HypA/HybF involved in hydrogenase expression